MASASSKVRGDGQAVALALGLAMLSLLLGTSLAGHVLLTLLVLWERSLHVSLLPAAAPVPGRRAMRSPASCQSCWLGAWPQLPRGPCWALWAAGCSPSWLGSSASRSPACCSESPATWPWPTTTSTMSSWPAGGASPCFPPVLNNGGDGNNQDTLCALQQQPTGAPHMLSFLLLLTVVVGTTHLLYLHLLFLIQDSHKMIFARTGPALSHDGTFHGPGATGQVTGNWTVGFGRGPMPPEIMGIQAVGPGCGAHHLLVLEEFKMQKRLCRMLYGIKLLFLLFWGP